MVFDYSRLRGKIKEVYNTQEAFCVAMGISERTLSLKLNNLRAWSQKEILKACRLLSIPDVEIPLYFFTLAAQ